MSIYPYAVKVLTEQVRPHYSDGLRWYWRCGAPDCKMRHGSFFAYPTPAEAHVAATNHAATCEALHRANWAAACPSCRRYGLVAPACPVCLGRGREA